MGELVGYPYHGVRPSYVHTYVRRPQFQTSSPKSLALSKPNLCGAHLNRGNKTLFAASGSHDQDGRHAHIW